MKDYELDKKKKGLFILNYEVKGNKIIVNYANGDKVCIDNTEKNESILISNMSNQVEESDNFVKRCKNNFAIYTVLLVMGVIGSIPAIRTMIINSASFTFLQTVLCGLPLGVAAFSGINLYALNADIKDVEKNKRFLEVEKEINGKVRDNENMLYSTHKVTKNIVKNTSEDRKVVFTINNVDKIPFSDLDRIMSNIEREEKFNFEYPEKEEPVKKKGLLK